ncbi:MAG: synthase subcomplex delta subunit [Acidobacteriaceae bacterium]|nr:synthase subcomplex delta subunit [Acidobacteriaceae bacterium]
MATVVSTYARAFADVVITNKLDPARTLAEVQQISDLVRDSKEMREVWETPSITAEQKRAVLDAIVKRARISQMVRNFIAVLIDKRRIKFLHEIVTQFGHELNQRLGFAEAEITATRELSAEERSALEADLARAVGKKIRARYAQDRAILGGAIARVGSTVYDGSVKGQLEKLRQQLVNT